MASDSAIAAETLRAYRETLYVVEAEPDLVLRINCFHPGLVDLYRARGFECAAFVTACNPHSRLLDPASNEDRQAALRRWLVRRGWTFLPGTGRHPGGRWPPEPSFLVLGLAVEAAQSLGRKFEQNAIVWCGPNAVPQLVLLR